MPSSSPDNFSTPVQAAAAEPRRSTWTSTTAILIYMGLATVVLHVLTCNGYGFQRDELATLEDARHLAWGYVAYPPVTPFFGRISLLLFGTSLIGFRVFAFLVMGAGVVLTGLMARELGGRRGAQVFAAFVATPFAIGAGVMMQYVAFDYFAFVLTAYFLTRLLNRNDERLWIAVGASIGLGMMSKYTMAFFVFSLVGALLMTPARRYITSKWLWLGALTAFAVFLPNFLWQAQHHFISFDFLRHIHARDVRWGRANDFLPGQLRIVQSSIVFALAGLYFYFHAERGRKFRMLGWMYVFTLAVFVVAQARWYYMGPMYPMLYAAGSVWGEGWLAGMSRQRAQTLRWVAYVSVSVSVLLTSVITLPVWRVHSRLWEFASKINGDYAEQMGWPEMAQTVAQIRDSLSPEERQSYGILAANYGEAGALNLYGPQQGLPPVISGVNSFWYYGYPDPPPQTLILIGFSRDWAEEHFESCRIGAKVWNEYGIRNEETLDHPEMFVCRNLKGDWKSFWKDHQHFG